VELMSAGSKISENLSFYHMVKTLPGEILPAKSLPDKPNF
jgi:hypothetical protein